MVGEPKNKSFKIYKYMYALVLNILGIFMFSNFFFKKVTSINWLLTKYYLVTGPSCMGETRYKILEKEAKSSRGETTSHGVSDERDGDSVGILQFFSSRHEPR